MLALGCDIEMQDSEAMGGACAESPFVRIVDRDHPAGRPKAIDTGFRLDFD
ncbi:MAG: hypothetical protein ABSE69_04615 [Roseiarcus sp.]